jgi:glutamate-1-semialdehyde 2,1-aminomutase
MRTYEREPVIDILWSQGNRLATGINKSIDEHRLNGYFEVIGKPCNLVYATRNNDKRPSQPFRTLFLQETIKRGILAPSFIVSYSHTDSDIDQTIEVVHESLAVYRKALNEGVEKYLVGRSVKPIWRRFN